MSSEMMAWREKCGVLGVLLPVSFSDQWRHLGQWLYLGLYALQHRGQESCGMATFDHEQLNLHRGMGLVNQVMTPDVLAPMTGQIGIGHTRYATTGSSSLENAQPVVVRTRYGPLVIAHNGNLTNTEALWGALPEDDRPPLMTGSSDTLVMAYTLRRALHKANATTSDAVIAVFKAVLPTFEGAYCLTMAFGDCLLAARDPVGFRPLSVGKVIAAPGETMVGKPAWVVASETCALDILGAQFEFEVPPGELVLFDSSGAMTRSSFLPAQSKPSQNKFCFFELVYFARPDSVIRNQLVYETRLAMGRKLAERSCKQYPTIGADMVIPVPDSGNVAAVGYSQATGVPYMEGLIKNRYVGRTFIHPTQSMRERSIQLKLNPMKRMLEGKRVVVVDDSIVRGNTSKKLVAMLRQCGVKEIHLRISSAPVKHPCFYGIDMSSGTELLANRMSDAEIADWLGVDSLVYLTTEDMQAVGNQNGDIQPFCYACFNGDYPTDVGHLLSEIDQTHVTQSLDASLLSAAL
ncbi:MAG: amidophosphoribosyltransferase [Vampirovibrionales bacterium]|nr:amidophosphoribosyltransferase [Vampirovibrionales bacterium]